ncbi:MAG: Sulfatase modifying factor 1 precursor [Myxococcaceae bacterium]|nr:Sulfatase modifying factor 1 precursor [Myxococcaceae bacterium]
MTTRRAIPGALACVGLAMVACTRAAPGPVAERAPSDASTGTSATATAAPMIAAPMIAVRGGTFERGADDALRPDERPRHVVRVRAFQIDATLVTRTDFARFVDATHYVTTAEKVGIGMGAREGMEDWEWERMPHASWRRPFVEGTPGAEAFLADDAPVVLVSWDDAVAYCTHLGRRLPTEAEWEYAMRAGARGTRYPWGDAPERDGKLALNFWQGTSHAKNLRLDGYLYVSPVRAYPPNAWGIFDPVGNVWQWTADVYAADTYARAAVASRASDAGNEVVDPRGPAAGPERVLRGGSWWCGACTCEGNGLSYRGKANAGAPYDNNGFRCAKDAP